MCLINAAVHVAVENDADTNAGAYRYVNEARLVLACSPSSFAQRGGIGIIFDRGCHPEGFLQILNRILSSPMGKKVYIADLAGKRIHRAGGADADPFQLCTCLGDGCFQHRDRSLKCALVRSMPFRRTLQAS